MTPLMAADGGADSGSADSGGADSGDEEQRGLLAGDVASAVADAAPASSALAWAARVACARVAGAPAWAWAQLAVAVLAVSTAGTAFLFAADVPPFLLAGWRLQCVTLLLSPAALSQVRPLQRTALHRTAADARRAQWRALGEADRARWRSSWRLMGASGGSLGMHFGLWVSSVQTTSLPHALLFVSATPVVLAAVALARRVPLSRGELGGTAAAMLGALVLVSDARSDTQARAQQRAKRASA
jgi:drug/metabolite transporter (DMT)-like permease